MCFCNFCDPFAEETALIKAEAKDTAIGKFSPYLLILNVNIHQLFLKVIQGAPKKMHHSD